MSFSTLSGRLSPNILDENNYVRFEHRKHPSYHLLIDDLDRWSTINLFNSFKSNVQLTRRNCVLLKSNGQNEEAMQTRVYERLRFECIHFGDNGRCCKEKDGSRVNQKVNAVGCKMFLYYKWYILNGLS